ncbi:MAG: hypothetical protein U0167_17095 [bacterium]
MKTSRVPAIALLAGLATSALLALDVWPAIRGPESWRWGRRVLGAWPGLLLVVGLFVLLVLVAGGIRRAWGARPNRARFPLLVAAVVVIFAQMVTLTAIEPGGLSNIPRRVIDPSFTTYHWIARDVGEVRQLLREYPRLQRTFPVHGASQPPGRVLFFDAVDLWASKAGRPERILALADRLGGVPESNLRQSDGERAGAFVAGWLLLAIGALTVLPLIVLAGGRGDPATVAAAVLLMGTVPSFLLFTPETDHLLLLLTLTSAAFLTEAMRYASRPWAAACALGAGLFAGAAVLVSLTTFAALLAWGIAFAGMVVLAARRGAPMPTPIRTVSLAIAALAGFAAVPGAAAWGGLDWPSVTRECFRAAQVVQGLVHHRDYSTWVRWNLWDFALFLGPPLVVAWLARVPGELKELFGRAKPSVEIPFGIALLAGVVALDLSGTILGETGRVWMFLMPLAAAAAGGAASRDAAGVLPLATGQLLVLLALRAFVNVPG